MVRKRSGVPSGELSDTRGYGSRIAPTGASEARSRYSADEVSRCGRWMQRAGGVTFPSEVRAPWRRWAEAKVA